jgi:putative ATP-dependent endonuclease of OLD family
MTAPLQSESVPHFVRNPQNTRGEILFARALVFFEGDTEEQALPDFAQQYWGRHPNDLGVTLVGVNGHGGYLPFLRLACNFNIPWFIFSDGEAEAVKSINAALAAVGETAIPNPRVIVLPNAQDFEEYILSGYKDVVVQMIVATRAKNEQHRTALENQWNARSASELADELYRFKTQYGAKIGKLIPGLADEQRRYPSLIKDLLEKVAKAINI